MSDYDLYGGKPPFVDGSDTSESAADAIESAASALRSKIHHLIKKYPNGLTCHEVEVEMNLRHQTASARIRELVLKGKLRDSGHRRLTDTRRGAVVWIPADSPASSQGPHKSLKDQLDAALRRVAELEVENRQLRQRLSMTPVYDNTVLQ